MIFRLREPPRQFWSVEIGTHLRYEDAGSAKWPGAHKENQGQFADLEIARLPPFPPGSWLVERGIIVSYCFCCFFCELLIYKSINKMGRCTQRISQGHLGFLLSFSSLEDLICGISLPPESWSTEAITVYSIHDSFHCFVSCSYSIKDFQDEEKFSNNHPVVNVDTLIIELHM